MAGPNIKRRRGSAARIPASLLLLTVPLLATGHGWTADKIEVTGRVLYQTGVKKETKPDIRAKVWLFRGRHDLALKSGARLREFEKRFPEGLTQSRDRPKEEAARSAAMVLTTYPSVHKGALVRTATVGKNGEFRLELPSSGTYTLLVEAGSAEGSYHMKRYEVRLLPATDKSPAPITINFGVSHLEHPH